MAQPITLCLDISGSAFTALLHLKFKKNSKRYTMTGSGTLGGGQVDLVPQDVPCGGPPGQSWTCEVTSADETHANYTLRSGDDHEDGDGGKTIKSFVETGSCGIPNPVTCPDPK